MDILLLDLVHETFEINGNLSKGQRPGFPVVLVVLVTSPPPLLPMSA